MYRIWAGRGCAKRNKADSLNAMRRSVDPAGDRLQGGNRVRAGCTWSLRPLTGRATRRRARQLSDRPADQTFCAALPVRDMSGRRFHVVPVVRSTDRFLPKSIITVLATVLEISDGNPYHTKLLV